MLRLRWFLLCVLVPASAAAQRMPTDTELHAAACIPIMQWAVELSRQGLAEYDKGLAATLALPPEKRAGLETLQKSRDETAQTLADADSALKRLQAYLLPRVMSLEPTAILLADSRGKADVQEIRALANSCGNCTQAAITKNPAQPDMSACANECRPRPVQDRLAACKNPTWLPF